jgi:DNA polymerase V
MSYQRIIMSHPIPTIELFGVDSGSDLNLPFFEGVSAGFPSPAADYIDMPIDLSKELVKNPSATFYGKVKGYSMKDAGIEDGDILIVDKSLEPNSGDIAVCFIDGEFTLKQIFIRKNEVLLMPANSDFAPIRINEENEFLIWGIVTFTIKKKR